MTPDKYLNNYEKLIDLHLFSKQNAVVYPNKLVHTLLLAIGLLWGIPWIQASKGAALLFASLGLQTVFSHLFAIGIIVTVGCDGLWVMSEVINNYSKQAQTPLRFYKRIVAYFCALSSCIPAVYAAVTYSTGSAKLLALIVLFVNYSYGLYGYSILIDRILLSLKNKIYYKINPSFRDLEETKRRLLNSISQLLQDESKKDVLENTHSAKQFLHKMLETNLYPASNINHAEQYIKLFIAGSVAFSLGLVDLYLTKHFIIKEIYNNNLLAILVAVITTIPGVIATFISTYFVAEKMLQVFSHKPSELLLKTIYPRLSSILPYIIFLIALTAPTAAGYITYTTLGNAGVNAIIQWYAISAIIVARFTFSYFTLSILAKNSMLYFAKNTAEHRRTINNKIKLKNLFEAISITHLSTV